jgi:hypothetical protein
VDGSRVPRYSNVVEPEIPDTREYEHYFGQNEQSKEMSTMGASTNAWVGGSCAAKRMTNNLYSSMVRDS